ncbi:MAG TPA: hypothetical protein VEZ11_01920 [Thermoanaerobaculia bacterium]|nr:hypothetical protein [Thermoanaerobaculia bacterium]
MIRRFVTSALFLSLLTWNAHAQPAAPSADDTAKRAIDVLAGPAWEKARYLAFTFNVEREGKILASFPQRWDRWTGDYRVSGKDREGHDFLVIMNINTKQGRGWKDGTEVQDPKDLLTTGYRRFINDTYWLLMPLKMLDPGVKREAAGERTDSCGNAWDLVKLSFEAGVGLTPGDQYWAWVNRNSGLVEEWDLLLQGSKPDDKPTPVKFYDFRRIGGLLISTKREIVGKNQWIKLDDVSVLSDVPKGAFEK